MTELTTGSEPLLLGRYALYDELASGGMATVHLGRLLGPVGFARTVAIKRLHPQHAKDPEFVAMFLDEARLAARIRHPNVVATLDVVATSGEVFLVMEYVAGESLASLLGAVSRAKERIPLSFAVHIASGALQGLHAAHEATNEKGEPLHLVHRDVSPHNVLVGTDGVARVLDFGVAKAAGRLQTTDEGRIKGKISYMAPEQLAGRGVSARTDIFAASVVLWEALTGRRLFHGADPGEIVGKVLNGDIARPSTKNPDIPEKLDALVMKGLARDPDQRFATALEMAVALEDAVGLVSAREVGTWVGNCARRRLDDRAARVAEIERSSSSIDVQDVPGAREVLDRFAARARAESMETMPVSGTGRSQIGSVVDPRDSLTPTRGRRFAPLFVGAALVLAVPSMLWFATRRPSSATNPTQSAPGTAAEVQPPTPSAVAPPATSSTELVVLEPPAEASSEPAASASASAQPARPAVPPKKPPTVQVKPATKRPQSIYTRD